MINFKALTLTALIAATGFAGAAVKADGFDYPACNTLERTDFPCLDGHTAYANTIDWRNNVGGQDMRRPAPQEAGRGVSAEAMIGLFILMGPQENTYQGSGAVATDPSYCPSGAMQNQTGLWNCY